MDRIRPQERGGLWTPFGIELEAERALPREELVADSIAPVSTGLPSILIIDDDCELCAMMAEYLAQHGFCVEAAHDGRRGLSLALSDRHDLIILDVMLPVLDGLEVIRHIRQRVDTPVIMLTAKTTQQDRIAGLDAGADDYLPKPFNAGELLARIRAVLRRTGKTSLVVRQIVEVGDIRLSGTTREVWQNDVPVVLTSVEFDILHLLLRSAGRVVSRDQVAAVLYQREASPHERSIDVHVSHLRKKLQGGGPHAIRTVRGVGYLFSLE